MAEIDSAGYEDLRGAIQDRWIYVALVDSNGNEVTRIDIPADARAFWADDPSTNPMTLSVTVGGDEDDIDDDRPVTIVRSELYKSDTATTRLAHAPISNTETIEAVHDELTHTIDISEPQ